jgi:hypothetical protein
MLTGYKTMLFNTIMGVILLVRAVIPDADVPGAEEVSGYLDTLLAHADAVILVIGNLVLRYFTKTPVFKEVP